VRYIPLVRIAKRLLRFAREQRANNVNAEAIVWRIVRDRRYNGAKFRRQVPLGRYVLDFVCFESKLAVEIDGPSHDSNAQQKRDAVRDAWIESAGLRVLRLSNELMIGTPELAERRIIEALERFGEDVR
jgi:very-short-patch-repair endonuclease